MILLDFLFASLGQVVHWLSIRGSGRGVYCISIFRGVGCIFTEMLVGVATFPGMKDAYDQLDQIFRVRQLIFCLFTFGK